MKITLSVQKVIAIGLALILITSIVTAAVCGRFSTLASVNDKLAALNDLVQEHYIEADDIDLTALEDSIASAMIESLGDTYAEYYTAEEYADKLQNEGGTLVGIGVAVVGLSDGTLGVVTVYDDSPAQQGGMQTGDLIVAVDGQLLSAISYDEAIDCIQGEEGSTVTIEILREEESLELVMTRATVSIPSVNLTMIDSIAYVEITAFTTDTVNQFADVLAELVDLGATGIVFDLRDNGGGLLDSVIDMLDMLLPEGTLVTVTDADGNQTVRGESDADCLDLPMVCLTNENTASAAELFVQALKDYDWAVSVGTTTYGKGVMQTTYALDDGTAVRLTVAYYNPPSGENYNGVGVVPDVEVEAEDDDVQGDVDNDIQLQTALELLA